MPVGPLSLFAESFAGNAPFCVNCGTLLDLPDTNNIVCDGCGCKYNYMGACAASPAWLWDPCGPLGVVLRVGAKHGQPIGLCSSSTCPIHPLPIALPTGVEWGLLSCFTYSAPGGWVRLQALEHGGEPLYRARCQSLTTLPPFTRAPTLVRQTYLVLQW